MEIIDSHVHFFDADRIEGIVWPPIDSSIRVAGNASPARRKALATDSLLTGVIVIETSRREIDDDWLLALAHEENLIVGAVLNLQPDVDDFEARLNVACESSAFVGIRLRPISNYDLSCQTLLRNLELLGDRNKTIEFGAPDQRLKLAFARVAANLQGTTLILDHAGHPNAGSYGDAEWLASMRKIAACPNAFVKVTMSAHQFTEWRETLDVLVELFGAERLLYGSNWPVSEVAEVNALLEYFGGDAHAFFHDNARRAYGISPL